MSEAYFMGQVDYSAGPIIYQILDEDPLSSERMNTTTTLCIRTTW